MADTERPRSPDPAPADDGAPAPDANGGAPPADGEAEGIKLYVGNLDYGTLSCSS